MTLTDRELIAVIELAVSDAEEERSTATNNGDIGFDEAQKINSKEGMPLKQATDTIVQYVNFYHFGLTIHKNCETRESADDFTGKERIACKRIEFREGEFDE